MRVVTTAFRVLEEVAVHQPVGVSELARILDEPKSTVQRALQALHEVGWVEQEPGGTRRWVQTTKLLALASRGGGVSLRERAMPVMQELLERTDENIHLSVRSERGITIIEKLESSKVVRPHDPLGLVAPLHATSTGKAILAWSDPAVPPIDVHPSAATTSAINDRVNGSLLRMFPPLVLPTMGSRGGYSACRL